MNTRHMLIFLVFLFVVQVHDMSAMEKKTVLKDNVQNDEIFVIMPSVKILKERFQEVGLLPFASVTNIINELGNHCFNIQRDIASILEVVDRDLKDYERFKSKHFLGDPNEMVGKRDVIIELLLKDYPEELERLGLLPFVGPENKK